MRVISTDGMINVSYENNSFVVIVDDGNKEYTVSARGSDLLHYVPLAVYDSQERAVEEMKKMADKAASLLAVDGDFVYQLP